MSEVKLKLTELDVYEDKYIKDGEEKVAKSIKFWDLGKNRYVEVEKIYDDVKTTSGEKDGKGWTINKTMVKYNDEKVFTNISQGALQKWLALPLGIVQVSKQEVEGQYGKFTTYCFEAGSRKEEQSIPEDCPF